MRGTDYFRTGGVLSFQVEDNTLLGTVNGSNNSYDVAIEIDYINNMEAIRTMEVVDCSCPRFDNGYYCKHIWAVILAYENKHGASTLSPVPRQSTKKTSSKITKKRTTKKQPKKRTPEWKKLLRSSQNNSALHNPYKRHTPASLQLTKPETQVMYLVHSADDHPLKNDRILLSVLHKVRKKNGAWGKVKPLTLLHKNVEVIENDIDRFIAQCLLGAMPNDAWKYNSYDSQTHQFEIRSDWSQQLLDALVSTDRLFWAQNSQFETARPLTIIDFVKPCTITIEIFQTEDDDSEMQVVLKSQSETFFRDQIVEISDAGVALLTDRLVRVTNPQCIEVWNGTASAPPIKIPPQDRPQFLETLSKVEELPPVIFPDSWQLTTTDKITPKVILHLEPHQYDNEILTAKISFQYTETQFLITDPRHGVFEKQANHWLERDRRAETQLLQPLRSFPIVETHYLNQHFQIHSKHLPRMVDELGTRGWHITLRGKKLKQPSNVSFSVESTQDWFDLSVTVHYDDQVIPLPRVLKAIATKKDFIVLADGSKGWLPNSLVEQFSRFTDLSDTQKDTLRFRPTQVMLLDALLQSQQHVITDDYFQKRRKKLSSFSGIKPKSAPRTFQGTLRDYQKEGIGWLHFLRNFGMGGCLADDMGLGKTIQILALLESRRTRRLTRLSQKDVPDTSTQRPVQTPEKTSSLKTVRNAVQKTNKDKKQHNRLVLQEAIARSKRKPSIVVVPKSLIFNWLEEAAKFTPRLRFVNFTGTDRIDSIKQSGGFDVLLTTYGIMRKDILDLATVAFDYAILDESQAIKNSAAQCAKASRLLRADYRLAMTGTPIENHMKELWSLFEFLNPGMLGRSQAFSNLVRNKTPDSDDGATLEAISKAIQPLLLRRTKKQVLKDLPAKTEQTLYCDMLPDQKKKYDELKQYYRVKLTKQIDTKGLGRSKIHVLEALLRLRQVACDPRLVDSSAKPGAKLELLRQQLVDVIKKGHKVLIFSQFTALLSLVKRQLNDAQVTYEYLDGKTTKRAECVQRFQNDKNISVFLISLKAGGHGLNLTAADYVFLLDPWWNPAVEAQAIDRAHRMGQKRPVIAYRMICKNTVEEKIVSMQQSKRKLAESIIQADTSLIRNLSIDDLQLLLG